MRASGDRENGFSWTHKRLGIVTLGCSRNIVDSEKLLGEAQAQGATICSVENATTVLVNTCGFTEAAKRESLAAISELVDLKKKGRLCEIIVHGCLSQRYGRELKKSYPDVDAFHGIAGFKNDLARRVCLTPPHSAYLKIAEGCANLCSYCAIPLIKGPLRSRDEDQILAEACVLQQAGVKELNIVGQDITLYGLSRAQETKRSLPLTGLVKRILKKTSIPWIRLLYLHPRRLTDDLLDLLASEKRVCSYLDVPLQHTSDRILKLMNRGMANEDIMALVGRVRRKVPGVALRTSLIVGFPSETREEFRAMCDAVRDLCFDRLGVFAYSREEGTRAYNFRGQISAKVKQERLETLMALQQEISRVLLKKKTGKTLEVMVDERRSGTKVYVGRTSCDAPEVDGHVFLSARAPLVPGQIVRCRITKSFDHDLAAEVMT